MQITAVFEHWHLGDRNYPAFAVGDDARVSFELDAMSVDPAGEDAIVLEADWLRFNCPTSTADEIAVGSKVRLRRILALDHYQRVEFLDRYPGRQRKFHLDESALFRRQLPYSAPPCLIPLSSVWNRRSRIGTG